MLKLHLGSGIKRLKGFLNVDLDPNVNPDIIADLRDLPFDDSSVDEIYACAVIEHFGRHEQKSVLSEWYRILRPGSYLYLSTTDFEQCARHYLENKSISSILGLVMGGQKSIYDHHGMIYDFCSLENLMLEAGFSNIKRYDWRSYDVGIQGLDDYSQAYIPHMDKETGRLMALNVCAVKL